MTALTQQQIFGARSLAENLDPAKGDYTLMVDVRDFQNVEDGGQIKNGKGITNLDGKYQAFNQGKLSVQLLYMMLVMVMQNQAEHINADSTQKIFITQNPPALGVGSRSGQIRYSYLVNVFVDSQIDNSPSADEI